MTPHLTPSRRYQRLIDRVSQRDREHFERHPDDRVYVRAYVPGECWPFHQPNATHVEVTNLAPGVRTRVPLVVAR